jgi:hypothetical protein
MVLCEERRSGSAKTAMRESLGRFRMSSLWTGEGARRTKYSDFVGHMRRASLHVLS